MQQNQEGFFKQVKLIEKPIDSYSDLDQLQKAREVMKDFGYQVDFKPLLPKIKTFDFTNQYMQIASFQKKKQNFSNLKLQNIKQFASDYNIQAKPKKLKKIESEQKQTQETIESDDNLSIDQGGIRQESIQDFYEEDRWIDFAEDITFEGEKTFKENKNLIFMRFFAQRENIKLKKFEHQQYSIVNFINLQQSQVLNTFFQKDEKKFYRKQFYQKNINAHNYVFSSNIFQGSLWKGFQSGQKEFQLLLQPDTNSSKKGIWFNFEFRTFLFEQKKVVFQIKNFTSNDKLSEENTLEIFMSSQKHDGKRKKKEILEQLLKIKKIKRVSKKRYHIEFELDIEKHTLYQFSFKKPYSKMQIQNFLEYKPDDINKHIKISTKKYGESILKLDLFYQKISYKNHHKSQKRAIILTHGLIPSDTPTFCFLKEFKNRLIHSKSEEELFLLQNYDFYIFPFINIDGIIFGNHTLNLAGNNISEISQISKHTSPELYFLLKELKMILNKQEIFIFCNLSTSISSPGHFLSTLERKGQFKFSLELPVLFSDLCSHFSIDSCRQYNKSN